MIPDFNKQQVCRHEIETKTETHMQFYGFVAKKIYIVVF